MTDELMPNDPNGICGTCGEIHIVGKYFNHNFIDGAKQDKPMGQSDVRDIIHKTLNKYCTTDSQFIIDASGVGQPVIDPMDIVKIDDELTALLNTLYRQKVMDAVERLENPFCLDNEDKYIGFVKGQSVRWLNIANGFEKCRTMVTSQLREVFK